MFCNPSSLPCMNKLGKETSLLAQVWKLYMWACGYSRMHLHSHPRLLALQLIMNDAHLNMIFLCYAFRNMISPHRSNIMLMLVIVCNVPFIPPRFVPVCEANVGPCFTHCTHFAYYFSPSHLGLVCNANIGGNK